MLSGEQQKVPMLSSKRTCWTEMDCQPINALKYQQEKHHQAHGDVDLAGAHELAGEWSLLRRGFWGQFSPPGTTASLEGFGLGTWGPQSLQVR